MNVAGDSVLANFKIMPGTIVTRQPDGGSAHTGLREFGARPRR